MTWISEVITEHKSGTAVGVTSVCSAHPMVIESAMRLCAAENHKGVLIEATSNQVDQGGGYTGMTPAVFRDFVGDIADRVGLPRDRVVLGGDHLGPNRWQHEPAMQAMAHAEVLIEAYVAAGFRKIHLDCSMPCADDSAPLDDMTVARRAARLAAVAERTRSANSDDLVYIVGTEVPVPGGAQESLDNGVMPTDPQAARMTIEIHRQAFDEAGVGAAFERVIGLVVQPGVEFDHMHVVDYDPTRSQLLSTVAADHPRLVFEAHSTDYQTQSALAALVRNHFAILKVGPGLTFALREALFALENIERLLINDENQHSRLGATVERRMRQNPAHWHKYYEGDEAEKRLARRFSLSDRIRYYWPDPEVDQAVRRLFANLDAVDIPLPLISRFLPNQFRRVRCGELAPKAQGLAFDRVADVLRDYILACQGGI